MIVGPGSFADNLNFLSVRLPAGKCFAFNSPGGLYTIPED